jgi:hypothetical protein
LIGDVGITSFLESGSIGFVGSIPVFLGSYKLPNAALLTFYTATTAGTYQFGATAAHSPSTSMLITGLAR